MPKICTSIRSDSFWVDYAITEFLIEKKMQLNVICMTPLACWLTMYYMLFVNLENENVLGGEAKGENFRMIFWYLQFSKKNKNAKIWWISALESRNWLNWKGTGPFIY